MRQLVDIANKIKEIYERNKFFLDLLNDNYSYDPSACDGNVPEDTNCTNDETSYYIL